MRQLVHDVRALTVRSLIVVVDYLTIGSVDQGQRGETRAAGIGEVSLDIG